MLLFTGTRGGAETESPAPRTWAEPVVEIGLLVVVGVGVVVLGGVLPWTKAALPIAAAVLAAVWIVGGRAAAVPPTFLAAALGLVAYLGFQLVPLPAGVLGTLSPTTAQLYDDTIGSLGAPASEGPSEAPDGEEILRIARESERGGDADRPIALNPFAAKRDLLLYVAYGLVLWMAATVRQPRFLLQGLFAGGVAVAAFAIVQTVTWNGLMFWFFEPYGVGVRAELDRMGGPFVNANHLGVLLAMVLPLGMGLLATPVRASRRGSSRAAGHRRDREEGRRFLQATLVVLGMTVIVAALIGTASRGSFFAVVLGGTVLWWGVTRSAGNGRRGRRRTASPRGRKGSSADRLRESFSRYAPGLVAVVVIVGGLVYVGEAARETLDMRFARLVEEEHWFKRASLAWQSAPLFRDFALFGTGIGGWPEAFSLYQRYPLVGARAGHAHDDYVEWMCEVGLVGVALTALLAWAWIGWARRNDGMPRGLWWSVVAGITAVGVSSLYEFGLRMPGNALVLAVLLGLVVNPHGARRSGRNDRGGPDVASKPVWLRLLGVAATAVLVVAALGQVREYVQWRRIAVDGSTDLEFASMNADTWYELGETLYGEGHRYDAATEATFRKTIDVKPVSGHAWWALSATALTREGQIDKLSRAVRLEPHRTEWRLGYAVRLDAAGRVEEGLEEITKAIVRDPRLHAHGYVRREGASLNEPLRNAVERGLDRALEVYDDDPRVWHEAASFRARLGDWAGAGDLWLRAAEATGDWSGYGLRAAKAAARSGNLARAETLFRKAIGDDPRNERSYRMLASFVYEERGEWDEAKDVLELGLRRVHGREAASLHQAVFELAKARSRAESDDGSGPAADEVDMKAALESLARAAELRNRDPRMQYRLGREYYRAEDYHRAKMAFERAIRLDPEQARFHHQLGATLERLYQLDEARDAYAKAVDLAPDNERYRKALERVEEAFEEVR